jgi:hypothetical protein
VFGVEVGAGEADGEEGPKAGRVASGEVEGAGDDRGQGSLGRPGHHPRAAGDPLGGGNRHGEVEPAAQEGGRGLDLIGAGGGDEGPAGPGGGLARVNGRVRLLEGLAVPREDAEFRLRYYNTLTTWVDLDRLLDAFGLKRGDLRDDPAKVALAVRRMAARVPTYVTIKDVKRRWGHGQEDVFPVAQFEKLWGDLTALPDLPCAFAAVDRRRGQQLKDAAQLDGWAGDGSREYVRRLCRFPAN